MDNKKIQLELYKMLVIIDRFCRINKIDYSLFGGTLLGTIRHRDFIPWDDDVDICMTRDNYQKFVDCWNKAPIKGFFLQNIDTDPEYTHAFAKIRKENTTYIEYEFEKNYQHTGLFLDIIILDRVHNYGILKVLDWIEWSIFFLTIRDLHKRFFGIHFKKKTPSIIRRLSKGYRIWFDKILIRRCKNKKLPLADVVAYKVINRRYSPDLCDGYETMVFHEGLFPVIKNYDNYLSTAYGNYMELPPVEKRYNHSPLILDYHHSYPGYTRCYSKHK